ncbi:MAG TPA: LysR family transcriptional regulator [Polyangiaceae bacterium]|nr:LysR family transcriptional regulator [Polyangiaceae bacterium]
MFELRHLRALIAIQRRGTLAAAARDIHVTQSALSHTLVELERVVGQTLLLRKVKPLRFTAAGLRLLTLAREILPAVDATEADLRRLERGNEGRLLLAMECHSCFDWLLPTLNAYRATHTDVELDVRIGMPFDPYPALAERVVDMLFSTDPTRDPSVHFAPLFRYQSVLICSPRHPLASRRFVTPRDLADETVITYPVAPERLDFFSRFLGPAGVAPQRVRHTELTLMIVQLVASGQGVAALPSWAVHREVASGMVRSLSLGREGLSCDLWAAVRAEEAELPFVRDFVETARKVSFETLPGISPVAATIKSAARGRASAARADRPRPPSRGR